MEAEKIVLEKSRLLLELQIARASQSRRKVFTLASHAATLETHLARDYLQRQDHRNAVISLNSAASCLAIAKRWREASRLFRVALNYARSDTTVKWIKQQLEALPPGVESPSAFSAIANIESNPHLRRPQLEAYTAAKRHFGNSKEHAIIQLPVGCGKTGVMAVLPFAMTRGRVLVVAPNTEIRTNLLQNFDYTNPTNFWKRTRVLANGAGPSCAQLDDTANVLDCDNSDFVVTNIQQLVAKGRTKWLTQFPVDYFDTVFIDEGHHNVAPSWQDTLARFPDAKIVSFTATPLRSDGQKVEGTPIYRFPIADAIREGYVKDIASRRLEFSEIYFTYKGEERRHTLQEVMQLRENDWFSKGVALSPECNRNIVDASIQCMRELREHGQAHHKIIAAACTIDHAKAIRSLYAERGLNAEVLYSDMTPEEKDSVRDSLKRDAIDVVVHVAMLGEGADYPSLSVAAVFRPYRHLVPYVQFVGRIMRVLHERHSGHPDNRGFVVSHFGLNIDRWWEELQELDSDDQQFYAEIANGGREFISYTDDASAPERQPQRRRFSPDMRVIEETITCFVQTRFLPEDSHALVNDLLYAMRLRGIDPDLLGISREDIEQRVLESQQAAERRGKHEPLPVNPQRARQEARRRLNERVRSGAKQLLNAKGWSVNGYDLPRSGLVPGSSNNLSAAIILLNKEIQKLLGVGADERDLYSIEECQRAHDAIDELIDQLVKRLQE